MRICEAVVSFDYDKVMWVRNTYALNVADATKLSLQILLCGLVGESTDNQCLECITTHVGILGRLVCTNVSRMSTQSKCYRQARAVSQDLGTSDNSFSISTFFSCFLRSRACNQLSVGT